VTERLSIKAIDGSNQFGVMLNPTSFTHKHNISYSDKCNKVVGAIAPETKFSAYEAENLDFEIMLDGTGAVQNNTGAVKTVEEQIEALKKVVYDYDGAEHEPQIVNVIWGTLFFQCRLTSLDLEYLLFKADGSPLRAKVKLAFKGFMTNAEKAKVAKTSSPDLTHIIEVKAGDTLPLLCHKIYKDSSYHIEVAQHNGLASCLHITPGSQLYFPPLISSIT
jgi:hypothetical protein